MDRCSFVARYDSRVKAMEVDERPTEQYSDIGGLDKQIQEVGLTSALLVCPFHAFKHVDCLLLV